MIKCVLAFFPMKNHRFTALFPTNIGWLQKDFRRVTRMRGAMPDELSVIVLMGKTAMDKESYRRVIPRMREEKGLFPNG